MNPEEIIEMAIQAGAIPVHKDPKNNALVGNENIKAFAKLVEERTTAKEREAIKSLAEKELLNTAALMSMPPQSSAAWNILQAIRAKGEA